MYLRNKTPTRANDGIMPYEHFYGMKPDVGHIRTFGCIVCVTLPSELMGYKYEGAYRVWIPRIGVKEVEQRPCCPTMGQSPRFNLAGSKM